MCVCVLFLSPQRKKKKTQKRKKNGGFSRLRNFLFFFFFFKLSFARGFRRRYILFFLVVLSLWILHCLSSLEPICLVLLLLVLLKVRSNVLFLFFPSFIWSFVVVKRNFSYWISKSIKRTQDTGVVFFHIHFCLPFYDTLQQLRLVLRYFARHSFFSHFVSYYHW